MQKVRVRLAGREHALEASVDPTGSSLMYEGVQQNIEELQYDTVVSGTVYGTLLNFKGALAKMGEEVYQDPYKKPPEAPVLYIKPRNTLTSHNRPVPLPEGSDTLQAGPTLGVVIGRTASKVQKEHALDYVLGYTVVNDVTVPHESVFRPAVKHRARDGFCPIGPWIVEKDCLGSPDDLTIRCWVNGRLVQENTTRSLVRNVRQLIADVTEFMTLNEGDTLLVGVAEDPPLIKAGDRVRIHVEGVGILENAVVPEAELSAVKGGRS
ncbi:fumarylacetoacetate hydrolase family protein [Alteribacter natronophilus]|uniref:fumarylacetoacetate hydrolase family protein n=1 Tax=Alteribacter natronophilus TaxID=2583810 RepID=UPI00110E7361|nr:fumarylacetoacetate hydrolase family protein [Alteribacter natronophilus]TMW71082.1 4-hydroxyphenylacetate isomerase [Alteribacter natronophilus]